MIDRMPVYFVSHGAPTLALDENDPTFRFFRNLGDQLQKPKSVLVISAHWEADIPSLNTTSLPETIHDFYGFPEALYQIRYPVKGDPALARRAAQLLGEVGMETRFDENRGLDHGAWVPLRLMYPAADVPIVQLSVQVERGNAHHYEMGKALRALRDEGVLIFCSGSLTHNLREAVLNSTAKTLPSWVEEFRVWVMDAIENGLNEELLHYADRAPYAQRNHPRDEHFLPLFVALGAADNGVRVHADAAYGTLAMDAYRFA